MPKERPSPDEAAEASTPLKPKLDDAATDAFVAVDDAATVEEDDAAVVDPPPPPTTPALTRAPLPTTPKPSLSLDEGAGADDEDEEDTAEPTALSV